MGADDPASGPKGGSVDEREDPVAPGGGLHIDGLGRIISVDPAVAERLGIDPTALLGRSLADALTLNGCQDGAADPADGDDDGNDDGDGLAVVAAVGHELRSPLTSIRGYTSLLLNRWDRIDDADKRLMLGQISHDAERVTRLINELLDISRIETGRLTVAAAAVDLVALADGVVQAVAVTTDDLEATVDFPSDGLVAWADADKVEQVLTNLLENAVKYASPRGLAITGRTVGDQVAVTVRDTGAGIAADDLERVFERWYQHDQGRPTGSGLGLWISRALVEAHGGTLTATSTPGEGTAFTFTLPTAP